MNEKEQKLLEGWSKLLGNPEVSDSVLKSIEEKAEKKKKEQKLLEAFERAILGTALKIEQIEEQLPEIIEEVSAPVAEAVVIVEEPIQEASFADIKNANSREVTQPQSAATPVQPQPQLSEPDFITKSVAAISKAASADSKKEKENPEKLPTGIRKELDLIKKSVVDLHSFASRISQVAGGGGDVAKPPLNSFQFNKNKSFAGSGLYVNDDYNGPFGIGAYLISLLGSYNGTGAHNKVYPWSTGDSANIFEIISPYDSHTTSISTGYFYGIAGFNGQLFTSGSYNDGNDWVFDNNGAGERPAQFAIADQNSAFSFYTSNTIGTVDSQVPFVLSVSIKPDGGLVVGNAAGGSKGPGTINVANNYYINGVNKLQSTVGVTTNYTCTNTDYYIGVNNPAPCTITLPNIQINGTAIVIKDEAGFCSINNITIVAQNGDSIDNSASTVMGINNMSLQLIYRNGWRIV